MSRNVKQSFSGGSRMGTPSNNAARMCDYNENKVQQDTTRPQWSRMVENEDRFDIAAEKNEPMWDIPGYSSSIPVSSDNVHNLDFSGFSAVLDALYQQKKKKAENRPDPEKQRSIVETPPSDEQMLGIITEEQMLDLEFLGSSAVLGQHINRIRADSV